MHIGEILRRQADARPQRPAFTCGGRTYSWSQTNDRVNRLAALLTRNLCPGDRVAILSHTCHRYFETYFACAKAGMVSVPMNVRLTAAELAHIAEDAGVRALVVEGALGPVTDDLIERLPPLALVIRHGEGPAGGPHAIGYEGAVAAGPSAEPAGPGPAELDLHVLGYTSGTTGAAKGAMLSHRSATLSAIAYATQLGLGPEDRVLACMPGYVYRGGSGGFAPIVVGAHTVVADFEAERVLALLAERRITQVTLAPAMALRVLAAAVGDDPAPDLGRMWLTGAPARPDTYRQLAARLGCEVGSLYGMTEATGIAMGRFAMDDAASEEGVLDRVDSVGRPFPLLDVRLVDTAGAEVGPGEVGEITVRGETVMLGYWNAPELTAATLRDGWLHTGDLAHRTPAGELCIVDRSIDVINSGGINVYTLELERAIATHPDVVECAVFGAPDDDWGEVPVAVVVADPPGLDEDAVVAWVRRDLAAYKKPRRVVFVDELPRNAMGKVDKRSLREEWWVGRSRRVHG